MFINTPDNYSSMWGELPFEYNTTDDTDIVVNIYDAGSDELLGVKKFYSSTTAKLDLAPLLFDSMLPVVSAEDEGEVATPTFGFPHIRLEAEESATADLTFTYATSKVEPPLLLTTMPCERLLYSDERDVVVVIAPAGSALSYSLCAEPRDQSASTLSKSGVMASDGGVRSYTLMASDYCIDYTLLTLSFFCDGDLIGEVSYNLIDSAASGYRLAWISSMGSIEHYTFPTVVDRVRMSDGSTKLNLRSAYGLEQEVVALSEIVGAARVWSATLEEGYSSVEVTTEEQYIRQDGALMVANIQIKENG
ncbi:MAG: hypothetical protein SNH73_03170 [Rikenellaceae bacterium]